MKKKIILIGFGGHAMSCISVLKKLSNYKVCGYIDHVNKNFYLTYLGSDANLSVVRKKFSNALISIGQIKSYKKRLYIYKKLKKLKFKLPVIKSKSSIIRDDCKIDEGSIIMEKVFINTNVTIGKNCIINTGSIIEHGATIGNNCHISTGVIINGDAIIKDNTFIGSGTIVNNGITVKKNTVVPSGSLINKKSRYEEK